MKIQGRGYIKNGNVETHFKNHFVSFGLQTLADIFGGADYYIAYNYNYNANVAYADTLYFSTINVGTNQSTPTTFITSSLVVPVSNLINPTQTLPITPYNGSQAILTITDEYPISALPQLTIGEIGLYGGLGGANGLISRASVADGDFSAFAYNPANTLIIQWNLIFTFV